MLGLTDKGRQCVESFGGDVSKYEEAAHQAGTAYNVNFHAEASGVQVSQGNHNTLNQDNRAEMAEQVQGFLSGLKQFRGNIEIASAEGAETESAGARSGSDVPRCDGGV